MSAPGNTGGPVTVAVDRQNAVGSVAPRAIGFSFEKNTLPRGLFSSDNAPLIALFRLLGPGVLRIGGTSVDDVRWDATGPGYIPGVVSPPDLGRLAGFLNAVDWQLIYGTPFLFSKADDVAGEATEAEAQIGARLQSFELCNEPDLYWLEPKAAAIAGTPALFNARWSLLADCIRAALPQAVFSGPAISLLVDYVLCTLPFLAAHPGMIGELTQHYYRGYLPFLPQTVEELLDVDPVLDAALATLRATATDLGIGYRLTETNSYANGGQPGVSDTFAAALWGADLTFRAAAGGGAGVNIQNSGTGPGYAAIVNDIPATPPVPPAPPSVTEIRPLFYGMLLAASAGSGEMPRITIDPPAQSLRVYAVNASAVALRVLLLNLGSADLSLSIDPGGAVTAAGALRLIAPAVTATSGVTFGGASVGLDGSWAPGPPESLVTTGNGVQLMLPAASAALVQMTLGSA